MCIPRHRVTLMASSCVNGASLFCPVCLRGVVARGGGGKPPGHPLSSNKRQGTGSFQTGFSNRWKNVRRDGVMILNTNHGMTNFINP